MKPLVSVVIPTYRRPKLVKRAVQSALAQTLSQIEVIVVIDGPHEATCVSLAEVDDSRLKVIELPTNQGCTAARRAGIAAAQAPWIANLDDDDEWMPQKLELQLEAANRSQYKYPIVTCYLIARTPQNDSIWPRRIPSKSEPLSEYLFVRNTFFQGEGLIQASTILTSKELLQKIPPGSTGKIHEDWGWVLRATTLEEVGIEFVTEALSVWYLGENRPSVSSTTKWRTSLIWIQNLQELVTPRAYASFILAEVSSKAAFAGEWNAFFPLLWEAIRHGKPLPMDIILYFGMWLISPKTRRWLRNLLTKNPQPLTT